MPKGDLRITTGAVSVLPVGREISEVWIAKSFFLGSPVRVDIRRVVER